MTKLTAKRSPWTYAKDPDYERTYFVRERRFRGDTIGVVQATVVDDFTNKVTEWLCELDTGQRGSGRTRDQAVAEAFAQPR